MKRAMILSALVWVAWSATTAQAGEINGAAVIGGGLGGAAGAAVGSAVGGQTGAIVGGGLGGAAGAAIGSSVSSQPKPKKEVVYVQPQPKTVVEREVVYVRDGNCWPPGHCKGYKHRDGGDGNSQH